MKEPEECYQVTDLDNCDDDDLDDDDDERTVTSQRERERASHCIININHLRCAIKKGKVCKCCAEQREINIIGHVADEFATYMKHNNINIPDNVIQNFKQECKNKRNHNHPFTQKKSMLELQHNYNLFVILTPITPRLLHQSIQVYMATNELEKGVQTKG
eukprot:15342042-Ditylum_brightwellii.AAC.1